MFLKKKKIIPTDTIEKLYFHYQIPKYPDKFQKGSLKYLYNIVLGKDSSCMAIVSVFPNSGLHFFFHCNKFPVFSTQIKQ